MDEQQLTKEQLEDQNNYMKEVAGILNELFPNLDVALILFKKEDLTKMNYLSSVEADDLVKLLKNTADTVSMNSIIPATIGSA